MKFLDTRTPRERILIYIGATLFILFVVWQFAINPVLSGKASAEVKSQAAQRDLDIVTRGVARLGSTQAKARQAFDLPMIVGVAQSQGLVISRTQPERDGAMGLWFADANTRDIYQFLNAVTQTYQLSIGRVQITQTSSGKVDAQITLMPEI